ncbi:MAG: zinc ribbon domain-containing protein [Dehalococcoidales bacterium]|nr:zinc ribbon domain-containing protein [Dehalococcoidales bacterium]
MPIYEYKCNSCNHKFELLRSVSKSGEDAVCPKCQSRAERVFSRCYTFSTTEGGIPKEISSSGCSSCSSGNCSSCGN